MSPLVRKGVEAITEQINLDTALSHSSDLNGAKEMFVLLHGEGESLIEGEIRYFASTKGWKPEDAKELAQLGGRIGEGKKPRIKDGPWFSEGLIEQWKKEIANGNA